MIDGPILLTGGTGFIGNKTLELLSNNFPNLQIFSVYRSANKPETIYDNVEWVHCNLIEDNLIKCLPNNIKMILHMAADARSVYSGTKSSDQYYNNINITDSGVIYR